MVAKEGAEAVQKGRQKLEETGRELLRSSTPASSFARVKGSARACSCAALPGEGLEGDVLEPSLVVVRGCGAQEGRGLARERCCVCVWWHWWVITAE